MKEELPVDPSASSNIKWARFDPVAEVLQIDFKDKNGNYASTYEYGDREGLPNARKFTRQDWERFREAERPGEHFAYAIRGKYPYRKVRTKGEPKKEQEKLF